MQITLLFCCSAHTFFVLWSARGEKQISRNSYTKTSTEGDTRSYELITSVLLCEMRKLSSQFISIEMSIQFPLCVVMTSAHETEKSGGRTAFGVLSEIISESRFICLWSLAVFSSYFEKSGAKRNTYSYFVCTQSNRHRSFLSHRQLALIRCVACLFRLRSICAYVCGRFFCRIERKREKQPAHVVCFCLSLSSMEGERFISARDCEYATQK